MKNNKTIIITGAQGQDGLILSQILLDKGYKVLGIIHKYKSHKIRNVKYYKIDLTKYTEVKNFIKKTNPSHIIHFGSKNPSFGEKIGFYKKNFLQTKNLIDSILEIDKKIIFIFPNSSFIFKKKKIVSEKDKYKITTSYTKFRIKISQYMKYLYDKKKFRFCNLILFNHDSVYRRKSFLIPRLIKFAKKEKINNLKKIFKENIIIDFSHAYDICFAIYLIIKKNITINNLILSSGEKTKVNDIINYILIKYYNKKKINIPVKKKVTYMIGKNSLAKRILGWKHKKNIFIAIDDIMKNKKFYD